MPAWQESRRLSEVPGGTKVWNCRGSTSPLLDSAFDQLCISFAGSRSCQVEHIEMMFGLAQCAALREAENIGRQ